MVTGFLIVYLPACLRLFQRARLATKLSVRIKWDDELKTIVHFIFLKNPGGNICTMKRALPMQHNML